MLRAKKVLVAKGGILAHRDPVGEKLWVWKNARTKSLHLDGPAKSALEMRHEVHVHSLSAREKGNRQLQCNDRRGDGGPGLPPFAQLAHAVRKFKRVPQKKVAPGNQAKPGPRLVHGMEHPAPTRARGQMPERIKYRREPRPKRAFSAVIAALCLDRPINQKRTPHNGVVIHEAPEAAVPALIAVIAHGKIFPRRHHNFIAPHEL